jgi:polar amino acid transport system substrate-binding protein
VIGPRLLAALLSVAAPLGASRAVGAERTIHVVTEHLPPYSYEQDGRIAGAATAVVRAAFERARLGCAIELVPWKRALDTATHDRNTFIYSVARTEGREDQLLWVGKICNRKLALYCLKERTDLLGHSLAELPTATVAVIQGDASEDLLRKRGLDDRRLHLFRDAQSLTAAVHVLEGRSDFFVSNPYRFEYGSRGTELEGRFRLHSMLWEGDGYYLAANRSSDPELVGRVRAAFSAMAADGTLKRVFEAALARPGE